MTAHPDPKCSFCGDAPAECDILVAGGPNPTTTVWICENCIRLSLATIANAQAEAAVRRVVGLTKRQRDGRPDPVAP